MSTFPITVMEPLPTIHTYSIEAIGQAVFNLGAVSMANATSQAWPTANLAIFVPFFVSKPITFSTLFTYNGATASGNIDIGVYDSAGTKIVSSGSTAQAGTSAIQTFSVTSTQIGAGQYYLALALSSTLGTIFNNPLTSASHARSTGMAQQATALPLPATATFASITNGTIPYFGLSTRSFV